MIDWPKKIIDSSISSQCFSKSILDGIKVFHNSLQSDLRFYVSINYTSFQLDSENHYFQQPITNPIFAVIWQPFAI